MSLHDRIMALPLVAPYAGRDYEAVEMRNHASELAREADKIMDDQFDIIKAFYVIADDNGWEAAMGRIDAALTYYKEWKEKKNEQ